MVHSINIKWKKLLVTAWALHNPNFFCNKSDSLFEDYKLIKIIKLFFN